MPFLEIISVIILLILNGIFSAGEMAIVSMRKSEIREMVKEKKKKKAEALFEMKENPERFLSAVQIGITLFGTLASAIGGVFSVKYLKPLFDRVPFVRVISDSVSLVIVVVVLTYFFLIIGELVPKYIGINYKKRVALWVTPIFGFTSRVFFVFVNFMSLSTMFVVQSLNLKKREEHVGEGEIKILLEEGRRKGIFDKTEEELIHGVFEFADKSVKDVMVPKPNIYSINIEESKETIMEYIVENEFSRYPVYKHNHDNIVGIVYLKDIFKQMWGQQAHFNLERLVRKPYFVPDTMKVSVLLKEMQKRRQHLAIVIDEYGTTVGIVTLEDLMEEVFGEIMDETDVDDRIEKLKDGTVIIDASYSVRDLNNRLNINLPESPDYETLGGFILVRIQDIPRGGEIIYHGAHRFTIVGIEGKRITKVKLDKP
ncbi:MAG: hemolysin family protein [Proteobacteria bacterium]|nr:hemolysin family protein [Pseudomonadota bacterium]